MYNYEHLEKILNASWNEKVVPTYKKIQKLKNSKYRKKNFFSDNIENQLFHLVEQYCSHVQEIYYTACGAINDYKDSFLVSTYLQELTSAAISDLNSFKYFIKRYSKNGEQSDVLNPVNETLNILKRKLNKAMPPRAPEHPYMEELNNRNPILKTFF